MISAEQKKQWEQDGVLKVPAFLNQIESDALREWIDEISSWPPSIDRWMHHFEQTDQDIVLTRSEYLIGFHDQLRQLMTTGKLPETIGELLGEPALLYKEKINYKYPGGGGYAAHQDAPAYEFVKSHLTCSIAIDPSTIANGCLYFATGKHHDGLMPMNERGCIEPELAQSLSWLPFELMPGDALFFSSYAPHYSCANESLEPRRSLYLTYNASAEGDFREAYYADKREALAKAASGSAGTHQISKIGHFQGKVVK